MLALMPRRGVGEGVTSKSNQTFVKRYIMVHPVRYFEFVVGRGILCGQIRERASSSRPEFPFRTDEFCRMSDHLKMRISASKLKLFVNFMLC